MRLPPVCPVLWSSLLILWTSQSGSFQMATDNLEFCEEKLSINNLQVESFSVEEYDAVDIEENENFTCFLTPKNILNCSWSFLTLQSDSQVSVFMSLCDNNSRVHHLGPMSEKRTGSVSLGPWQFEISNVILHFNVTLNNTWAVYAFVYDAEMLDVLSPPSNISASIKDGDLLVTWDLPRSRARYSPTCFQYQLDLGDQEIPKDLIDQLSYTMPNADPDFTYRARIKAKINQHCLGAAQWSDWSHTARVEQSPYKLNILVIISISLGIPTILLALLLFLRHQRVSQVLFPPIPHPPPKYKYFLEKNDMFGFYQPAVPVKSEEKITEVEVLCSPGESGEEHKSIKVSLPSVPGPTDDQSHHKCSPKKDDLFINGSDWSG